MPLIDCPECSERISNRATACPHCGCPLADNSERDPQPRRRRKRPVLVELTGKVWKVQLILSAIVMTVGILLTLGGMMDANNARPVGFLVAGILLTLLGVGWQITVRVLIWWHHR